MMEEMHRQLTMDDYCGEGHFRLNSGITMVGPVIAPLVIVALIIVWLFPLSTSSISAQTTTATNQSHIPIQWEAQNSGLTPSFAVAELAIDPRDPAHLVAAIHHPGSLLESWDGGRSWQPVPLHLVDLLGSMEAPADNQLWATDTVAFTAVRFDGNRLLLGSQSGLFQILLPMDRRLVHGIQMAVFDWPDGNAIYSLARGPSGTLYAAGAAATPTAPAVWRRDQANSWRALAPLPSPATKDDELTTVLATNDLLLAGLSQNGLFISRDEGRQWRWVAEIGRIAIDQLWVAPWDAQLLIARAESGLWRSDDGGGKWRLLTVPTTDFINIVAAYGDNGILIGLNNGSMLYSPDLGNSWQPWGSPLGEVGAFRTLQIAPDSSVTLLAGTEHGLSRSVDGGLTWQRVQIRNMPRAYYALSALIQNADGILYLGNHNGIYRSADRGNSWQPYSEALPPGKVTTLAINPQDTETENVLFAGSTRGVFRRKADEPHWRFLGWPEEVALLVSHREQAGRLYLVTVDGHIYVTDEALLDEPAAASWLPLGTHTQFDGNVKTLLASPTDPQTFYTGNAAQLFRSVDDGQEWHRLSSPLYLMQGSFGLLVDAHVPSRLLAGTVTGLFQSMDDGSSWQRWGKELNGIAIHTVAQHPSNPQIFFAGTLDHGLWYTTNNGNQWQQVTELPTDATIYSIVIAEESMHGSQVVSEELDKHTVPWISVATDRGFWRGALPTQRETSP